MAGIEFEFTDYERALLVRGLGLLQSEDEFEEAEAEALARMIGSRGRPHVKRGDPWCSYCGEKWPCRNAGGEHYSYDECKARAVANEQRG